MLNGQIFVILIASSKKVQTHKTTVLLYKKLARRCEDLEMFGLKWAGKQSSYSRKGWIFCKKIRKCKILASLMEKEEDNLEDHGCPKNQYLVDGKPWICSSYPFRHKTDFDCAKSTVKLFGNWIMHQSCENCNVDCFVPINEVKSFKLLILFLRDSLLKDWA